MDLLALQQEHVVEGRNQSKVIGEDPPKEVTTWDLQTSREFGPRMGHKTPGGGGARPHLNLLSTARGQHTGFSSPTEISDLKFPIWGVGLKDGVFSEVTAP